MMFWYKEKNKPVEVIHEYNTVKISLNLAKKIHEYLTTELITAATERERLNLEEMADRLGTAINERE